MERTSIENKKIRFDVSKNMKCLKKLGQGGTGSTYLFLDESIGEKFAIKKYIPSKENDKEECFFRFIEEIKILYKVFNKNVVRIFNYYLYRNEKTGYIQMEYIDGKSINNVNPGSFGKSWNDFFIEIINAFDYLHENGILHRDIRPSNFMVENSSGDLKIIDFGFGKKINEFNQQNSIILNWPASVPPEEIVTNGDYTFSTEIYYIAEMFENLIQNDKDFLYYNILKKMKAYSPENRYRSCKEIKEEISNDLLSQINFTEEEKNTYLDFANELYKSIVKYTSDPIFVSDVENIVKSLGKIVRVSSLEKYVQNNNDVISCFVNASYKYKTTDIIESSHLINFYKLLVSSNAEKQKIIIDTINSRLKSIKVELNYPDYEDLPF